ncbi:MAG: thioredoxin 2 [Gammaproteobacteria bacterium]|jgi:thioredoxin 2|nr:thioredoxin 2 [Gammaproteobacteria bacterium]
MTSSGQHIHVVCGHCDSVVRLPSNRLSESPRCPSCHSALFEGTPLTLTSANFDKHVSRGDLPLVVDFWAPWCGPCLAMAPFFEKTARQLEPKLRFAKLDTEDHPAPAAKFNIRSIPTMIVFRGGKEIARHSGAMDGAALTRWLGSVVPTVA